MWIFFAAPEMGGVTISKRSEGLLRQRRSGVEGRDGCLKSPKQRHQREKTERMEKELGVGGRKEREEGESDKGNTVRVMCVGVVLHVYEPEAYLALLFPKKWRVLLVRALSKTWPSLRSQLKAAL